MKLKFIRRNILVKHFSLNIIFAGIISRFLPITGARLLIIEAAKNGG